MATLPTLSFPWNGEIQPEHAFGTRSEAIRRRLMTGIGRGRGGEGCGTIISSCRLRRTIAAHLQQRHCRPLPPLFSMQNEL